MHKVCLIIPCYNEASRLQKDCFFDFLETNSSVSLCFVNDGSKDGTIKELNFIKEKNPQKVFILDNKINQGKAGAVRSGVLHISEMKLFDFIGFWDADLSTPLTEFSSVLNPLINNNSLVISIGSRWKRMGAVINRKIFRHYFGRIFATFASIILKLPVYDTQCGAKIFRSKIALILFGDKFITKWIFDVEILARLRNSIGIKEIHRMCYEVPLTTWKDIKGSKLGLRHLLRVPYDLLKIYIHYNQ